MTRQISLTDRRSLTIACLEVQLRRHPLRYKHNIMHTSNNKKHAMQIYTYAQVSAEENS